MRTVIAAAVGMLDLATAYAQEKIDPSEPPAVSDQMWPMMIKLAVAVVVVVALIYVTTLLLKKLSFGRSGFAGNEGALEVLERSYFAPKKFVCLLRVQQKVLLVGVSENGINLVADVSDQHFPPSRKQAKGSKAASFKSILETAKSQLSTVFSKV